MKTVTERPRRPAKAETTVFEGAPAVVLVQPQLGENIGMVARAMLNCGLTDLRLVKPKMGWPNPHAEAPASGAEVVLENVRVYETTRDAIEDLTFVIATTARPREMVKPVFTPRAAAREIRALAARGEQTGILFGREAVGLHNDDVSLADAILNVPLNPAFSSLNLAQCVLLVGYEWFGLGDETPDAYLSSRKETRPATKGELTGLFEHLETELDKAGFLWPTEKAPAMVRNIRNMLGRAGFTEQEVRTFRGIIAALTKRRANRSSGG
jgi:tRNA/rRNA methyltransferase